MNIQIDPQASPAHDFFFRAADRMRIEGCANAVAREGLSLVLYTPYEALLDHYLNLLLDRLRRQAPQHKLEVYFPTNTESLIARFNDALASQSVRDATRATQDDSEAQIWIVHDTQHLPDHEIQLMARLIQNFPGANIRAILLMTGASPHKESLSALGRKVLRWDIEAPTPEQAQAALDQAQNDGQRQAVAQLLRRMRRLPSGIEGSNDLFADSAPAPLHKPDNVVPVKPGLVARARAALTSIQTVRSRRDAASLAAALIEKMRNMPRSQWQVIAGLGAALALSISLMLWLQPQAFRNGKAANTAKVAPAQTPAAALPPASAAMSPVASTQQPLAAAIEVPDETQQAQAWARSFAPSSFVVQHASVSTYEKAIDIKKNNPAIAQARIVAAHRPGEPLAHFVVISGPFDNLGQAYESIKRREATKSSWVRASRSLQEHLNGPSRPKE